MKPIIQHISRASLCVSFNLRSVCTTKPIVIVTIIYVPSPAHLFAQMFARTPPYPPAHMHNRRRCTRKFRIHLYIYIVYVYNTRVHIYCICILYTCVRATQWCVVSVVVVIIINCVYQI